jgi:hypothetical protein
MAGEIAPAPVVGIDKEDVGFDFGLRSIGGRQSSQWREQQGGEVCEGKFHEDGSIQTEPVKT